jgi:hypothetical protein
MAANRPRPGTVPAAQQDLEPESSCDNNDPTWSLNFGAEPSDLSFGSTGTLAYTDTTYAAHLDHSLFPQHMFNFWDGNPQEPSLLSAIESTNATSAGRVSNGNDGSPASFLDLHRIESGSSDNSDWVDIDPVNETFDYQISRSEATSSTSLVSVSSNSASLRHPAQNSEASELLSTKKSRGHFKSSEKREQTSRTRKIHACVRCRMQRVRVGFP